MTSRKMAGAILALAALAGGFGSLAAAAPSAAPAASPAQIDAQIMNACRQKGGKHAECACGLKIAHEELTQRQLGLVPVLWPIVKSKNDTATKISLGLTAAQNAGYSASEALSAVFAVQNQASRTQKECKARGA